MLVKESEGVESGGYRYASMDLVSVRSKQRSKKGVRECHYSYGPMYWRQKRSNFRQ